MEFDLAMSTLQWWIATVVLFAVCSIMAGTFLIAATVIVFTQATFSPGATILLMGGLSAAAACVLFFCLKTLAKKMTFRTLRDHLTRPEDNKHVETRA
jgi:membrane protein implicated in regulation of membrane protease activity